MTRRLLALLLCCSPCAYGAEWAFEDFAFRAAYESPAFAIASDSIPVEVAIDFNLLLGAAGVRTAKGYVPRKMVVAEAAGGQPQPFQLDPVRKTLAWTPTRELAKGERRLFHIYFNPDDPRGQENAGGSVPLTLTRHEVECWEGSASRNGVTPIPPPMGSLALGEVEAFSGERSLRIACPASDHVLRWHYSHNNGKIPITPGLTLELRGFVRLHGVNNDEAPQALVWVSFLNKEGNVEGIKEHQSHAKIRKTTDWQELLMHVKVPENAAYCTLRCEVWMQKLAVDFNAVSLRCLNPPLVNVVQDKGGREFHVASKALEAAQENRMEIILE